MNKMETIDIKDLKILGLTLKLESYEKYITRLEELIESQNKLIKELDNR